MASLCVGAASSTRRRIREQRLEIDGQPSRRVADDHDVLEPRQRRAIDRLELAEQGLADHQHARAAVAAGRTGNPWRATAC